MSMNEKIMDIISEAKSPLFRIMAAYDLDNLVKRRFENNISAFHIGKGYFLSVSHSLIFHNNIPRSVEGDIFENDILSNTSNNEQAILKSLYKKEGRKYYWNENPSTVQQLLPIYRNHKNDFRYEELYKKNICSPYLLIQFRENTFYNNSNYDHLFDPSIRFYEENINRYTFLIKLKLLEIFVESDMALYRIDNNFLELLEIIPSIELDFSILNTANNELFCLQGAPINELGRMLNKAMVDGHIDHFSPQAFIRGKNYYFSGLRYLIKGFFRFGSSGAPYLIYNQSDEKFYANAIQSEACPLAIQINNNRDGNAQFISAIASPIWNIKNDLERLNVIC